MTVFSATGDLNALRRKNEESLLDSDIYDGYKDRRDDGDCIAKFRNALGTSFLDFGSAYYPWANTSSYSSQI
jgi:hypothetical protein